MLADLFRWILSTTAMASVLLVFIFVAKWLLKDKLNPRWSYLLWVLLALRLLLPWTPESSFSIFNILPLKQDQMFTSNIVLLEDESSAASVIEPAFDRLASATTQPIRTLAANPIVSSHAADKSDSLMQIASWIWLIGAVSMFIFMFAANLRFALKIKKEPILNDKNVRSLLTQCLVEMKIRRHVALMESRHVSSPTLFGIMFSKLLLPISTIKVLNENQLRYVFLHELSHMKRYDIAMNWLMSFLLALHWFNPLLWYAYHKMREDQEMACDSLVLTRIHPSESKDYALTIIKLLEAYSSPIRTVSAASFSGNKKELRRRIIMLTSFKRSYKWSLLGLSIILLLGGSVLTNAKTPNARAAAGHPIDNVKPFAGMKYGPNHALVALENDYIGQIEKMNSEGEYMNEVAIIMNLHGMTHQKIKADRIGFSVKMTPEMIELMMENIKKAPNIEDRDNYLTIVKRWKAGDFTRIREDHDYLNKRQGGTIGFSIGVNSPEEEAVFVKKYFSDKIQSIQPDSDTRPVPGPISPGIQKDSVSIPAEQYQFMSSIYKSVGIRKLLSKDRQEAAVKEWLNGKDDLSDLEALPPQTTAELLLEIEKMYQGEKPFTEKRAKALAVIARNGLIKAEMDANKAIFPFPGGFTFKNDHPDTANASFRGSYEMFHQYIDKAIAPFVERISKQ